MTLLSHHRHWLLPLTLFAGFAVPVRAQGPAQAVLPDGPGKGLVQQNCTRCHGVDKFTGERHTREDWAEEVDVMVRYGYG